MDCNKEEAVRAKAIAEKKMQNKDFVGAQKILLRSQQLCPDLENISQMLTVCNVHCSAEHKLVGCEMDWYGILQLEQAADELSIKKQYRKLALLLHPDKNKFAGAEAAFKLIGEAHRVLSDQNKRSMYDMRYRASMRTATSKPSQQQQNRNSRVRKQPEVNSNFGNIPRAQFTGVNTHQERQQTKSGFCNGRQTFWTACPFCNIRYQYYKDVLNKTLRCQSCIKPFIAYDLDAQGVPAGANLNQSSVPNTGQGGNNSGSQSNIGSFPSNMGFQGNFGSKATSSEPFVKTGVTSDIGSKSKTKGEADGMERKSRPNFESEKPNTSSKKRKKYESETSESCDTESSIDTDEEEIFEEGGGLPAGQNAGFTEGRYPRRSARQKQNVSYNEDLSDNDDFVSPSKKSKGIGSTNVTEDRSEASLNEEASKTNGASGFPDAFEEDEKLDKQKGSALGEESLLNTNAKAEKFKKHAKDADLDDSKERSEAKNEFKSNLGSRVKPDAEYFNVPDSDLYDFDRNRKEECFASDQVWAIYDNLDGMPRFYAQIKKVFYPGFKVRIAWLQCDPVGQDEINWCDGDLPISCGVFKYEKSEITEELSMFSHLVFCEKGTGRGSYKIYPRKGEIWALFKNWDIKWSSDPDNYRSYEFEFVEVLSNYAEGSGITVAYLVKVKGFVSLFRLKKGMISFQIPPKELFRFSHRVPSYRTTGTEREDIPEGYFELDPASLPDNLGELSDLEDVKVNIESVDTKINGSCSKSPMGVKPSSMEGSINHAENNTLDKGNLKSEIRSPRKSKGGHRKQSQENLSQCVGKEENYKHVDSVKDSNRNGSTRAKVKQPDVVKTSPKIVAEDSSPPHPFLDPCEIPEPEFYDFEADKTQEKFQPGQIWALYCDLDSMPKYYAQIDKTESSPDFKLHITWLDPIRLPKDTVQWFDRDMPICCGTFKLAIGETAVYTDTSSFSHLTRAEPSGKKNRYEIYPRKGEVWALYKDFNSKWTCSDLKKCDYDMVEILEDGCLMKKVLVLGLVDGFETVFKAQRKGNSAFLMEISRIELLRFSHRVPAFRLTGERGGKLRGCWELSPTAMPVSLFRSD